MESGHLLAVFALVAALPLVYATPACALEHDMLNGAWLYQAWLCVDGPNHGWIYSIAPPGIPQQLKMFKVELQSFNPVPPYAATLNCYEQFTDVGNGVKPGPQYSWHFKQSVTLNAGEFTSNTSDWAIAECPPIKNFGQQPSTTPPEVLIYVAWNFWFPSMRTATPFAPFLSANPAASAMDGAVSSLRPKKPKRG
ncbi:Uncharacterised protein [Candidatus Norongarragalina meridionalis]|nr:Uncharacterised protein [Candidatus Norongarragalina meridionalis]